MRLLDSQDADGFHEKVDEAARLIEGLKKGSISPEYVDKVVCDRNDKENAQKLKKEKEEKAKELTPEKELELKGKVAELKERYERKEKARKRYSEYVRETPSSVTTDYQKWDMWCPSDNEDDLIHSCTPNSAEFFAMEKDIDERHKRMVTGRQIAQREKEKGNQAYKQGQVTEAYRCYTTGLLAEKHNMELHSNASLMSIKMGCHLQAIEHCDKVLHIADAFHENPTHPLCAKALQRRAIANKGLQNYSETVKDLARASEMLPANQEVMELLEKARKDMEEHEKERSIMEKASKNGECTELRDFKKIQDILKNLESCFMSCTKNLDEIAPKGIGVSLPRLNTREKACSAADESLKDLRDILECGESTQVYFRNCQGLSLLTEWLLDLNPKIRQDQQVAQQIMKCLCSCLKNSKNMEVFTTMSRFSRFLNCYVLDDLKQADSLRQDILDILQRISSDKTACLVFYSNLKQRKHHFGLSTLINWIEKGSHVEILLGMSVLTNCVKNCGADTVLMCPEQSSDKLLSIITKLLGSNKYSELESSALLLSSMSSIESLRRRFMRFEQQTQSLVKSACNPGLPVSCLLPCFISIANCMADGEFRKGFLEFDSRMVSVLTLGLSNSNLGVAAAASLALARAAKEKGLLKEFDKVSTLSSMVVLLNRASTSSCGSSKLVDSIIDGVILAFATLSSHGKTLIDQLVLVGAVAKAIEVLHSQSTMDSLNGNLSLLLSNVASHKEHTALMKDRKTICGLIDIAHKSHPTSRRNAGIALARLAQDPSQLKTIRKLHGLDVIYNYVKP